MVDSTNQLLSLLKNNATLDRMKQELNVTDSQLLYRLNFLKYNGYMIERKYYGNGDITIGLSKELPNDDMKIYTKVGEETFRSLVMADLHRFHKLESKKALDTAINYCIKNEIHNIFICGDLIDAMASDKVPMDEQIDEFIEEYPKVDHINSFFVLGNHERNLLKRTRRCLQQRVINARFDLVPINYATAKICIKKDALYLSHPIKDVKSPYGTECNKSLIYRGHSHTSKVKGRTVYVPSLSYVKTNQQKDFLFTPQCLDTTIAFNKEKKTFKSVTIDQLMMADTPGIISENVINLGNPKPLDNHIEVPEYPSLQKTIKK